MVFKESYGVGEGVTHSHAQRAESAMNSLRAVRPSAAESALALAVGMDAQRNYRESIRWHGDCKPLVASMEDGNAMRKDSVENGVLESDTSAVAAPRERGQDAPCDFAAFLASRLGVESESAALQVLGVMLRKYQPRERRAIDCLVRQGHSEASRWHGVEELG